MPIASSSVARDIAVQQHLQARMEAYYFRQVAREINRAMRHAADQITQGAPPDILSLHQQRITNIMRGLWLESARVSSERILAVAEQRGALGPMVRKREEFPDMATPVMDGVMAEWVRNFGTQKIKQIAATTQSDINVAVQHAIRTGMSEVEAGKLIKSIAPTKSRTRAQTIARTEVHSAAQAATHASASLIRIEMVKVWRSVQDGGIRTRDDHLEIDGQTRAMQEYFDVGFDQLMYPGDPTGSPEQIINCRCVSTYELAE